MSAPTALNARVAFLLTIPPLLWASNIIVGRAVVGAVPPIGLNLARWLMAFVLLWPLGRAAWREHGQWRSRWQYLSLLGLLGVGCYNAFQYLALQTSSALNVSLIAASSPVWMLSVGMLVYRITPRRKDLIGALLSLLGVALVITHGEMRRLIAFHFVPGDLLMIPALLAWSFYSWLLAKPPVHMRAPQRPGWDWAVFLQIQIGFGLMWCLAGAGGEAVLTEVQWHWSPAVLAAVAYIAIGPSLVAYRCWGLGVSIVGPAVAGFFVNLTPVFAAVMSAVWLGETPHWYHGAAFALIVAGIVISSRR